MEEEMMGIISNVGKIVDFVNGSEGSKTKEQQEEEKDKREKNWDRWLEDVELGFTNRSGVSDSVNPYGKPYSQRPRIREIGNTSEDKDEGQ